MAATTGLFEEISAWSSVVFALNPRIFHCKMEVKDIKEVSSKSRYSPRLKERHIIAAGVGPGMGLLLLVLSCSLMWSPSPIRGDSDPSKVGALCLLAPETGSGVPPASHGKWNVPFHDPGPVGVLSEGVAVGEVVGKVVAVGEVVGEGAAEAAEAAGAAVALIVSQHQVSAHWRCAAAF